MPGGERSAGRWEMMGRSHWAGAVPFFLLCSGRSLSSRHLQPRCCTKFGQSGTGRVFINVMLRKAR